MNKKLLKKGLVGSHLYGCNTPESDKDYISVFIYPINHYFGLQKNAADHYLVGELEDNTEYEFLKFIQMCCKFNTNVLPLLWSNLNDENTSDADNNSYFWDKLVSNRNLFVNKKLAFSSFIGHANAQQKRCEILMSCKFQQDTLVKYNKSASHAIRLLRTAENLFKYDEMNWSCVSQECLDYRSGKYSYDEFLSNFENLKKTVRELYESNRTLPDSLDVEKIDNLCVGILSEFHFTARL